MKEDFNIPLSLEESIKCRADADYFKSVQEEMHKLAHSRGYSRVSYKDVNYPIAQPVIKYQDIKICEEIVIEFTLHG